MKNAKKVSVVIPNYNYERYIKKRLRSILWQTYPIYELIILDDCSTDGSVDVIEKELERIKKKYPSIRVQFIRNKKNSGKAMKQWKKGFELAKGDYVWIAEADDLSSRRFLEEVMRGFDDPSVVISYAESAIINGWGMMIAPNFRWSRDKEKTGHYKKSYVKDGKQEIEEIMAIRCTVPNVSAVVFRNDENYLRYFDEAIRFSQVGDWYFYVKILENGKISYNKKSLNRFRIHNGSKTSDSKMDKRHYEEVLFMHDFLSKGYTLSRKTQKALEDEEARVRLKHGIIE
ncbi:MAG: glycosyltransferase family 2 protein [Candidatus Saccharibacteria bacterium]|nr:glycosyltransferase family 2 protein [Candidatus Saccharibacteria bacterium]